MPLSFCRAASSAPPPFTFPFLYSDCKKRNIHKERARENSAKNGKETVVFSFETRLVRLAKGEKPRRRFFSVLHFFQSFRESKKKLLHFFLYSPTRCRSPPSRRRHPRGPRCLWRLCRQGIAGITPPRGSRSPACSEGQFFFSFRSICKGDTRLQFFCFSPLSLFVPCLRNAPMGRDDIPDATDMEINKKSKTKQGPFHVVAAVDVVVSVVVVVVSVVVFVVDLRLAHRPRRRRRRRRDARRARPPGLAGDSAASGSAVSDVAADCLAGHRPGEKS